MLPRRLLLMRISCWGLFVHKSLLQLCCLLWYNIIGEFGVLHFELYKENLEKSNMNASIDVSNVVLHTERLTLRPWRLDDLADLYEYASVDGVGQMAGWLPHKDKEESGKILQMFIDEKITFAIEFNGKVIGSLGIEAYNEEELTEFSDKLGRELGFVLSKAYWGRGLMPEAVQAVIKYLFETVGLDFIVCGHFVENAQSQRAQEKCGFNHYKLVKYTTQSGVVKDTWLSILERTSCKS